MGFNNGKQKYMGFFLAAQKQSKQAKRLAKREEIVPSSTVSNFAHQVAFQK